MDTIVDKRETEYFVLFCWFKSSPGRLTVNRFERRASLVAGLVVFVNARRYMSNSFASLFGLCWRTFLDKQGIYS